MSNNSHLILWTAKDLHPPEAIRNRLMGLGYRVFMDVSPEDVIDCIERLSPRLWVTHADADRDSDLRPVEAVRGRHPFVPCLIISRNPNVEQAVRALKLGFTDYLPVHTNEEQLWAVLEGLLNFRSAPHVSACSEETRWRKGEEAIAADPEMRRVFALAKKIAPRSTSVLIQGESGSGKEVVARFIHENSDRRDAPFVAVNCAALPENLLESELFGHEKGAFTGAINRKRGRFELAAGGHLLLDEISEMPQPLQAKLLRVLQEREIDRLGGQFPVPVDVRVIATSNRDLHREVESGDFRLDLFYRLNVVPIRVPPLRERPADIIPLAHHFIEKHVRRNAMPPKRLSQEAEDHLKGQRWPGNVRELENAIERAVILTESEVIQVNDLLEMFKGPEKPFALPDRPGLIPLREMEKQMIFQALEEQSGNRTHAAKVLGISVRTLRNKLHEYREELGGWAAEP